MTSDVNPTTLHAIQVWTPEWLEWKEKAQATCFNTLISKTTLLMQKAKNKEKIAKIVGSFRDKISYRMYAFNIPDLQNSLPVENPSAEKKPFFTKKTDLLKKYEEQLTSDQLAQATLALPSNANEICWETLSNFEKMCWEKLIEHAIRLLCKSEQLDELDKMLIEIKDYLKIEKIKSLNLDEFNRPHLKMLEKTLSKKIEALRCCSEKPLEIANEERAKIEKLMGILHKDSRKPIQRTHSFYNCIRVPFVPLK